MAKNGHATKEKSLKTSYKEWQVVKKCQNHTFKNINLGVHYLSKSFLSKLNFWTTLLSKITPNFWQTVITHRIFFKKIPWWHVDSWPKSLLLRIHHLWNSTTKLILISMNEMVFWRDKFTFKKRRKKSCDVHMFITNSKKLNQKNCP